MDTPMVFKLNCLTDLHMGSGEVNYSVIDLEVQRDTVTGEPTMHSSGVKGALRDYCEAKAADDDEKQLVVKIFGSDQNGDQPGTYRFLSADLLARPVRISAGSGAYVLATTPDLIRLFLNKLSAFGLRDLFPDSPLPERLDPTILCSDRSVKKVEGFRVEYADCPLLDSILGTKSWALMPSGFLSAIDLPVRAHNVLNEKGISKNLWYEQNVPHESVFGLLILAPDGGKALGRFLSDGAIVQFGANASTGGGLIRMERVDKNG